MSILGFILFGFVVGLIARAIMPGRDALGLLGTTLLGIVGAVLAGWLGQALGWYQPGEGAGFIAATIGAIVVLFLYHAFFGRRRARSVTGTSSIDRHDRAA
ncbi:MAG TPA: GlsB/YeaQ/YmgE family stress response membrane protein [Bdellovibrionota bacterium]|nr:GlsB/YeaQ/YmgE family stress response membrane protein [Bdellovibrionota bacterium]